MGSNREKSNFTIAILEKLPFLKGIINHFAFDGSNNIFVDFSLPGLLDPLFMLVLLLFTLDIVFILLHKSDILRLK